MESLGLPFGQLRWIKVDASGNSTVVEEPQNSTELYLNFKSLTRQDTGNYQCEAINTIGDIKSDTVTVTVTGMKISKIQNKWIQTTCSRVEMDFFDFYDFYELF